MNLGSNPKNRIISRCDGSALIFERSKFNTDEIRYSRSSECRKIDTF